MQYHIPKELPYNFLKSIDIFSVEQVKIDAVDGSKKLECFNNVKMFLKSTSWEIQLGWVFAQLGNIALKLNAHAVVKLPNGSFRCVTPSEHGASEINFAPDDSVASLIVNDRLPAKIYPLVSNKVVDQFVKLENFENKMRLENNKYAVAYILDQKYQISNQLIEVFNNHQK
ncbi:hypothetical protein swp_4798 [Shewanella piezotolerans WP3]|uniref:Uncharacterized protein n=1 Tax=Shewanella piezotolerans (strain WP3 / JCM 13877) TaxID=225849 RepID=B8CUU9_SHEPW|nr:hypothetical protein [Shewanella piezotolerans]ACJ31425.1 hypothetical protein swp_4798 [Shewanella piezotolerans WP3]